MNEFAMNEAMNSDSLERLKVSNFYVKCLNTVYKYIIPGSVLVSGQSQTQMSRASRCCTVSGTSQELSPCKVMHKHTQTLHTRIYTINRLFTRQIS